MSNSRSKNVLWGSLSTVILSICTLISGLIVPRLIMGHYGSSVNGLASSISQFISYFNLLEAGLAGASVYALYKPLANREQDNVNSILSESKSMYNRIGIVYFALVVIMAVIYPMFTDEVLTYWNTVFLVVVIGLSGALEFITMSRYRVLLTASQKTYVISLASILGVILKIALVYLFTALDMNVIFVYLISAFSVFLRSLILRIYTKIKYPEANYNTTYQKGQIKQRKDVMIMQVLGSVQHAYPVVLMTLVGIPFKDISVYNVYGIVIHGLQSIVQVFLNGSIYASFGELIVKDEKEKLKKVFGEFETLCFIAITTLFTCLAILYLPFIRVYTDGITDAEYYQPVLAVLLTANIILYTAKNPMSAMIQAAGHYKKTRWRTITQALIGVVVPTVLAPFFGIPGIIIGMIASNLYRTIDVLIYVPKKILGTGIFNSVKKVLLLIVSVVGMYLIVELLVDINAGSYLEWFLYAAVIFVIAFIASVLIYAPFCISDYKNLFKRLKRIVKK